MVVGVVGVGGETVSFWWVSERAIRRMSDSVGNRKGKKGRERFRGVRKKKGQWWVRVRGSVVGQGREGVGGRDLLPLFCWNSWV